MNDGTKTITVNAVSASTAERIAALQMARDSRLVGWHIVKVEQAETNAPDDLVMLYQVATGKSTFLVRISKAV